MTITTLLRILTKHTTKIRALKFNKFYSDYEPQLYHTLINIIKSQKHLDTLV